MHVLTDGHDWLVSLWLMKQSEYATIPSESSANLALLELPVVDDCPVIGIRTRISEW